MEIREILILYLPSVLYLMFWISLNNRNDKIKIQLIVLSVLLLSLMIYGFIAIESKYYSEITPIGYALMISSPLLLLGPILKMIGKKIKNEIRIRLLGTISTLIIPPIGVYASFWILFFTNQITGV